MNNNTKHKNTIFLTAKIQHENLGDIIINKTLVQLLRSYGSLVIDDYEVPEWIINELEIKEEERSSNYYKKLTRMTILMFTLKRLFKSNTKTYLVLTPGHSYHSDKLYSINGVLKNLVFFCLLSIIGVRICRFGASIGPFATISRIAEKWQAKFMYFYSVRDNFSKKYAQDIGINNADKFPDLAWLMDKPSLGSKNFNINHEYVLFSFRKSSHELDDPINYQQRLYLILDEIVKLVCIKLGKKLVISYQVTRDYKFCQDIMNRYKKSYDITLIEEQVDSHSMYSLYSQASMIFSNRLHVLMFGMLCGSLPIAVVDASQHDKITGIFSDAGLNRLVIDISNEQNKIEISGLLNKIYVDHQLIKEQIALCIKQNKEIANDILKKVMY